MGRRPAGTQTSSVFCLRIHSSPTAVHTVLPQHNVGFDHSSMHAFHAGAGNMQYGVL